MATVTINGKKYITRGPVRQSYVQRQTAPFRTAGVQNREDDASVNRYLHRNFLRGFGPDRINRETGKGIGSFRDATCMTHWPSGVYLPLLAQESTEAAAVAVMRAGATFKGQLWSLWSNTSDDAVSNYYTGSTTTWTAGGAILALGAGDEVIPLDLMADKTHLLALMLKDDGAADGDHHVYRTTAAAGWGAPAADVSAGLMADAPAANEDIDAGLLSSIAGEAVAILWHEDNGTITFFSSADAGNNWVDEAVDIASSNGPQGVAVYLDTDSTQKLYVGTREGLWIVDTSPATWTMRFVLPVTPHNDNFRRMTVHQGKLWFGLGVDDDSPAPVWTLEVNGDTRVIETYHGLDQADGLPVEMMGPVRWMKSSGRLLFASIGGGAASRNARVLVHNGEGWHSAYRHGTANLKIEWIDVTADDDGTPRLHFSIRTAAATSNTMYLAQPSVDPASGIALVYDTSGYLRIPVDDLGDAQTTSTIYQALVDADDLSAADTGEYIVHSYGLNGAADTTTELGDFLSGDLDLSFGSGAGVAGKKIAQRLTFHRDAGSTADTPKLREFEIQARNQLFEQGRKALDMTIDLAESAKKGYRDIADNATEVTESIITDLEGVVESTTMVTFVIGRKASTYVQVPLDSPPVWELEVEGSDDINPGFLTGFCKLRLEQGI